MNSVIVFASDFHGIEIHYKRLFDYILKRSIPNVIFGGDLCPGGLPRAQINKMIELQKDFLQNYFLNSLNKIKRKMPKFRCYVIMGNDDFRVNMDILLAAERTGVIQTIHQKIIPLEDWQLIGYSFVQPTPFLLKDWEKYEDASQLIDPISMPPEQGFRSTTVKETNTIEEDLKNMANIMENRKTIFVSHAPPYKTLLDQSSINKYKYEGLKLDKNLGSTSIRRFIENNQPDITLHGHIHE